MTAITTLREKFTRSRIDNAVMVAGNNPASTTSDIRRLMQVQFAMTASDLATLNREDLDKRTVTLLDYFSQ